MDGGNYFLEPRITGSPMQRQVNQGVIRLSRELDIPLAATNDCHYINAEDWEAHDILLCIQTEKRWPMKTGCGMRAASIM